MDKKHVVRLLCLNDFHAEVQTSEFAPGCAGLVEAIERFRAVYPNTFVLFGGDNYRGDPISETTGGEPVTQMMHMLETKASVIGNHEFDFGPAFLKKWQDEGGYQFVAANVVCTDGAIAPFAKPYVMLESGGVKIAVIGLALEEPLATSDRPAEMHAFAITDSIAAAKETVAHLMSAAPEEKPQAIIALTHFGLKYALDGKTPIGDEAIRLCREIPEIDGVFTAHFHQVMSLNIHGVPVVQGGSHGRAIAVLKLEFEDNSLRCVIPEVVSVMDMPSLTPNPAMLEVVERSKEKAMEKLGAQVAVLEREIIHRSAKSGELDLEGSALSALAIDVMMEAGSCPIAMLYAGRIGRGLPAGPVSHYSLYQALPFENVIVTMDLPGEAILQNVEKGICTLRGESVSPLAFGGLKIEADYAKPYGERASSVRLLDGKEIDLRQYYKVAIDNYLAESPMGFDFTAGRNVTYLNETMRNAMVQRVCSTGVIPLNFEKTVRVKNKPTD